MKEIGSMERVIKKGKGEVKEVRATPGWERVRECRLGPLTPGPKEIARALETKETEMTRRLTGHIAASGASNENNGEKDRGLQTTERV